MCVGRCGWGGMGRVACRVQWLQQGGCINPVVFSICLPVLASLRCLESRSCCMLHQPASTLLSMLYAPSSSQSPLCWPTVRPPCSLFDQHPGAFDNLFLTLIIQLLHLTTQLLCLTTPSLRLTTQQVHLQRSTPTLPEAALQAAALGVHQLQAAGWVAPAEWGAWVALAVGWAEWTATQQDMPFPQDPPLCRNPLCSKSAKQFVGHLLW